MTSKNPRYVVCRRQGMFAEKTWESAGMPNGSELERSQRFARLVLEAFRQAGRTTDAEVATAGGPSDTYMTTLRNVAYRDGHFMAKPRGHTQKRIETAANWKPGSAVEVWQGGEPTLVTPKLRKLVAAERAQEDQVTFANFDNYLRSLVRRVDELEERLDQMDGVVFFTKGEHDQVEERTFDLSTVLLEGDQDIIFGREVVVTMAQQLAQRYLDQARGDAGQAMILLAHDGADGANVPKLAYRSALNRLAAAVNATDRQQVRGSFSRSTEINRPSDLNSEPNPSYDAAADEQDTTIEDEQQQTADSEFP